MTPDGIFQVANLVALMAWLLLVVLPRVRWVAEIVATAVVPALLSVLYVALLAAN